MHGLEFHFLCFVSTSPFPLKTCWKRARLNFQSAALTKELFVYSNSNATITFIIQGALTFKVTRESQPASIHLDFLSNISKGQGHQFLLAHDFMKFLKRLSSGCHLKMKLFAARPVNTSVVACAHRWPCARGKLSWAQLSVQQKQTTPWRAIYWYKKNLSNYRVFWNYCSVRRYTIWLVILYRMLKLC